MQLRNLRPRSAHKNPELDAMARKKEAAHESGD